MSATEEQIKQAQDAAQAFMDRCDTNKDGVVEFSEVQAKWGADWSADKAAEEKFKEIKKAYEKEIAMMDDIRGAKDKNTEEYDTMEEAYDELVAKTREALLEIPTDLHVFTDLNVANDIVEDVFSISGRGTVATGRMERGKVKVGDQAICRHGDGKITKGKITMIYHFEGMKRIEIQEAHAGDIIGVTGAPLSDITTFQRVLFVMKDGKVAKALR